MSARWERPKEVSLPSVWTIVEGKKPLRNGKVPRFRIQDTSPNLEAEAIQHMSAHFLRDEPYCLHLDLINDEESVMEMKEVWKEVLKHRIGLIALLDNAEELGDPTLPKVAGCNMTFAVFPEDKDPELKSPKLRSVLNVVNLASHAVDCFKKYNAPVIMYALGLSVDPIYRGQGLGEEILKARYVMGKAVGIPLTTTVFTGAISQASARKAGFEFLAEINPEDYEEDGKIVFKGVNSKCVQLMAARIN